MTVLNVDAIVNSTDESMTAKYPVCERIYQKAGSGLKHEIKNTVKGEIGEPCVINPRYTWCDKLSFVFHNEGKSFMVEGL